MNNKKNKSSKRFSISDYIFAKCYGRGMGGRGNYEMDTNAKLVDDFSYFTNPFSMRALNVGTDSAGGYTVGKSATDSPSFGGLYSDSFFLSRGTIIPDLTSDLKLNEKSAGTLTATSVGENVANTFSAEPVFSEKAMTPHFIRCSISVSATLLDQTSVGLDTLILNDMKRALGQALDHEILYGAGGTTAITGLSTLTGISSTTWGPIASLTGGTANEKIILAEYDISSNKVPPPYHVLFNSLTRASLRQIKDPNSLSPVVGDDGRCTGFDFTVTENIPDGNLVMCAPEFCVICLWHPLDQIDLLVDRYTLSVTNEIQITLSISADASLAKLKSLSIITE